jgi:DNA-binding MarR family transcriptional regulator
MQGPILDLEEFLPYRLNRLADAVSRNFWKRYGGMHGLTRPEWRTLAALGQCGTMTATAIGAHSAMHKTKVSRAVAGLERRRWLQRRPDAADRRLEHLELTAAGRSAYGDLVPVARAFEADLLERMDAGRKVSLLRDLAVLEAALGADMKSALRSHQSITTLPESPLLIASKPET